GAKAWVWEFEYLKLGHGAPEFSNTWEGALKSVAKYMIALLISKNDCARSGGVFAVPRTPIMIKGIR
ncbi:hypothetical protein, partial [Alloalcanivorax venustensis]|uniref:hypothetical protein n=1 Tax=Alloalcanivorax venustensis TaxID=172371 RepID=UPI003C436510